MLNDITLNVTMLNAVMLSVMAPLWWDCVQKLQFCQLLVLQPYFRTWHNSSAFSSVYSIVFLPKSLKSLVIVPRGWSFKLARVTGCIYLQFLATFSKIGRFFPSHLVTLVGNLNFSFGRILLCSVEDRGQGCQWKKMFEVLCNWFLTWVTE